MKDTKGHVLPECYADTLLVSMLIGYSCNHQSSISKVFTALKITFKKKKALGVIDNDKKKDKYYDEFRVIVDTPYYKYLAHPNKKHFLIAIKGGGIEKFIMNCAEEVDYTHPLLRDLDRLKSVSKSMNSNPDLKNILNTLIQRKATALMEIQGILQKHI